MSIICFISQFKFKNNVQRLNVFIQKNLFFIDHLNKLENNANLISKNDLNQFQKIEYPIHSKPKFLFLPKKTYENQPVNYCSIAVYSFM
jgi:hypothetical protein